MYVEEQEPLKIEVGNFYKTRNGKKAYCFYKEEDKLYPNHIAIDNGNWDIYTDDGLTFCDEENPEDIVGYWE